MTGVDIFLGRRPDDDNDDDDDNSNGNNGVEAVQEFVKKRWNLNARFRDDSSEDRLRPETFDLINSRLLAEGINADRWQSYVRELKQMLKPGGWLQMVELQLLFQDSTGQLGDDSNLTRWWQWYSYTLGRMGKNPRIGRELSQHLTDAGFENVRNHILDLPIGDWKPGMRHIPIHLLHSPFANVCRPRIVRKGQSGQRSSNADVRFALAISAGRPNGPRCLSRSYHGRRKRASRPKVQAVLQSVGPPSNIIARKSLTRY